MMLRWTQHLGSEQGKEDFQNTVLGAKEVLDRLSQIIDEDLKVLDRADEDFSNVNWSHKAASNIGARKALLKIKELLNLDQRIIRL